MSPGSGFPGSHQPRPHPDSHSRRTEQTPPAPPPSPHARNLSLSPIFGRWARWVRWVKSESHTGEESRGKRESAQRVGRAQRVGSTQLPEGVSEPSPPGPPGPPGPDDTSAAHPLSHALPARTRMDAERRAHPLGRIAVAVHQPLRRRGTGHAQPAIVGRRRTSGRRPTATTRSSATTATRRARDARGDGRAPRRRRSSQPAPRQRRASGTETPGAGRLPADSAQLSQDPAVRGTRCAIARQVGGAHRLLVLVAHSGSPKTARANYAPKTLPLWQGAKAESAQRACLSAAAGCGQRCRARPERRERRDGRAREAAPAHVHASAGWMTSACKDRKLRDRARRFTPLRNRRSAPC